MRRAPTLLAALLLLSALSLVLALAVGSATSGWTALHAAFADADSLGRQVVLELRWPRALSAFATGGLLALAGVVMQALLRNPLADPYVLGVSGGAAVAAMLALLAGLTGVAVTGSAFLGALAATVLVFGIARGQRSWTPTRLLLTGVVLAAGWGALIGFILTVTPEARLPGLLFWLLGDLGYASAPGAALLALAAGIALSLPLARQLNVLVQGALPAQALGVAVARLRLQLYLLGSLLAATAVVQAGTIGFVGLVVPHMVRLLGVTDHRVLIPAAALLGGSLLVVADTLARSIIAPQQLPVGVLTALLGVPLFLLLLNREAR